MLPTCNEPIIRRVRPALLIPVVVACGFTRGTAPGNVAIDAPQAWLAGASFRKPIVITPGAALSDFPVGILEAADPELALHAQGALAVTADDALTVLDHELVALDPATGALELWVRVPSLGPAPTTLYLYYGGTPPAPGDPTATWSSLFAGVWHLSDAGMTARDSTGHHHDLAAPGPAQMPAPAAGIAGGARSYNGVADSLAVAPPQGSLDFASASFSYSMWVNVAASAGAFDAPLWRGGTSSGEPGYCFLIGTSGWLAKIDDGASYYDPSLGAPASFANQWTQLVGVVDRAAGTFTAFANGAMGEQQMTAGMGSLATTEPFDAGRPAINPFRGLADELRVYTAALSADWVAAEHANLTSPGFIAIGAEQAR